MHRISELEHQIREYVNRADLYERYFRDSLDEWTALCVAMDVLGDTCLALANYEDYGIGSSDEEKYLRLYGFLQGVHLQQDAIRQLHKTFLGRDLKTDNDSAWMQIRDLRNLTVGHPIEKTRGKSIMRCSLSRITMQNEGFQLGVWDSARKTEEFRDVDLNLLYGAYKSEAIADLREIHEAQMEKWAERDG